MRINSIFFSALVVTGITACSDKITPQQVCKTQPEFCADLNTDGWCRKERADVLVNRYNEFTQPTEQNKYQLLLAFESYKACIKPVSAIEPKKNKARKQQRLQGYVTASKEIQRLVTETKLSNDPYLAIYHYSRERDEDALARFLQLEGSNELETPELQLALGQYYMRKDRTHGINILLHALELFNKGDEINNEVFETLSSVFYTNDEYKLAYIWAQIAQMNGSRNINIEQIIYKLDSESVDFDQLDDVANRYLDSIVNGTFVAPVY